MSNTSATHEQHISNTVDLAGPQRCHRSVQCTASAVLRPAFVFLFPSIVWVILKFWISWNVLNFLFFVYFCFHTLTHVWECVCHGRGIFWTGSKDTFSKTGSKETQAARRCAGKKRKKISKVRVPVHLQQKDTIELFQKLAQKKRQSNLQVVKVTQLSTNK